MDSARVRAALSVIALRAAPARNVKCIASITCARIFARNANERARVPGKRNTLVADFVLTLQNRGRYKESSGIPSGDATQSGCSPERSSDKGMVVNKSDLIDAIAKHADISKAAAGRALDATVDAIRGSLKKGTMVTLVGFGSFYVGKRTARAGRNPRTGDAIKIRAAKVPKFRAGKALKDALN